MSIAENLKRYRNKNQLSQEELAEKLAISRQSISKWETGENLPSIDNLITLSEILSVSLDELATGGEYLRLPFDFGKPKSKRPVWFLFSPYIVMWSIVLLNYKEAVQSVLDLFLFIAFPSAIAVMFKFGPCRFINYKAYYRYFTVTKAGINYVPEQKGIRFFATWFLAYFSIRKTEFIKYSEIESVRIWVDNYRFLPRLDPSAPLPARQFNRLQEKFTLTLITKEQQTIVLDLSRYFYPESKERGCLYSIIQLMKNKNIKIVDKQGLLKAIRDKESVLPKSQEYTTEIIKKVRYK